MGPSPEDVGLSDVEAEGKVKNLSLRLKEVVSDVFREKGKCVAFSLLFEPKGGFIHPMITANGEYALGGEGLKKIFPVDYATHEGYSVVVDWGGKAGKQKYDSAPSDRPLIKKQATEDNLYGIFAYSGMRADDFPNGRLKAAGTNFFVYPSEYPDADLDEIVAKFFDQIVLKSNGQRTELIDAITEGLEKAGLPLETETPDTTQ